MPHLYLKVKDDRSNEIFFAPIKHFEASRFGTAVYTDKYIISESDVIRFTDTVKTVQIVFGKVIITYTSNWICELSRQ